MAREAHAAADRRGDLTISVHLPTFAWDGDDGWERVRDHHRYVAWKYDDMEAARSRRGPPLPPPPTSSEEEAALRTQIVLGRPEEVAARIGELNDAAGGDLHYIARLYWPGMDPVVQRYAMAVFAEEVIPKLR
jgi:alkanesulfonate monooxygenase SsuD/methylene tetrahydromethanopterin reductase-like flavin-dependent oxidoreductase (luciferase family)